MSLYTGIRDSGFIKGINRELIHAYISTEVGVYKINLESTKVNIYEESVSKSYNQPVRIFALIKNDTKEMFSNEYGISSTKTFSAGFIKSDLKDKNIFLQEGDIIEYDNTFFEIDNIRQGYWSGRNPDTNMGTKLDSWNQYGYDISIIADCHQTNLKNLHIVETNTGLNPKTDVKSHTKYIY